MKIIVALVAVLALAGCQSNEERCTELGGVRVIDKTNTGVGPVVGGNGGVTVTVSTTTYCLDANGGIVEVW